MACCYIASLWGLAARWDARAKVIVPDGCRATVSSAWRGSNRLLTAHRRVPPKPFHIRTVATSHSTWRGSSECEWLHLRVDAHVVSIYACASVALYKWRGCIVNVATSSPFSMQPSSQFPRLHSPSRGARSSVLPPFSTLLAALRRREPPPTIASLLRWRPRRRRGARVPLPAAARR